MLLRVVRHLFIHLLVVFGASAIAKFTMPTFLRYIALVALGKSDEETWHLADKELH